MLPTETIRQMLLPGKRLDAGRVWEVVELIEGKLSRLAQLLDCLFDNDPAIASRAEPPTCSSASLVTVHNAPSRGKMP